MTDLTRAMNMNAILHDKWHFQWLHLKESIYVAMFSSLSHTFYALFFIFLKSRVGSKA